MVKFDKKKNIYSSIDLRSEGKMFFYTNIVFLYLIVRKINRYFYIFVCDFGAMIQIIDKKKNLTQTITNLIEF